MSAEGEKRNLTMESHEYYDPEVGGMDGRTRLSGMDPKVERQIRHGFIRKVYGIVSAQLLCTTCVACSFILIPAVKMWVMQHALAVLIIGFVVSITTLIILMCVGNSTQIFPRNYILLALFTAAESALVGLICLGYDPTIVMQAFIATTIIVMGLTLFAFQSKYDFTSWAGAMFFVLLAFIVFGLIVALFPKNNFLSTVYACLGALIFSLYLVIDTQLLIGRGKFKFEEDDYISGAITIYLDIINLFIFILQILDRVRG